MTNLVKGILVLFQILLLWLGVAWADICVYEEISTGREFTKYCDTGCCEHDCCTTSSSGAIIGGVIAFIFIVVFTVVWITCRLVPSCPLAKHRRTVLVRRTIVTTTAGLPSDMTPNSFQNPLANPPVGVTVPQGQPPSYDQAVPPTFTPLPATVPVHQGPASNKI